MKILLLDMDGVLLNPLGYHEALQENVRRWGRALGFADAVLRREDILRFESAGVSAEWVSGAMCVALLQLARWERDPDADVPPALSSPAESHDIPAPDFGAFARELLATNDPRRAVQTGIEMLEARCQRPEHATVVRELITQATQFSHSPFHRSQQELVLGSDQMQAVYGAEPELDTSGYLLTRDRPLLSAEDVQQLLEWRAIDGHAAAVMTNRPSHLPAGGGSPEAELGLQLLGLEALPYAGMGAVAWLAGQEGLAVEARLKPHAVHALTAIRLAMGTDLMNDLAAVAALLQGELDDGWRALDGAELIVLEDSANGCLSTRAAQDLLGEHGLQVTVRLHGIAPGGSKRRVLEGVGATVFADSAAALNAALAV